MVEQAISHKDVFLYEFDRLGYVLAKSILEKPLVDELLAATNELENYFNAVDGRKANREGPRGFRYVFDEATAASTYSYTNPGRNLIVDDFFSAHPAFTKLIGHPATLTFVKDVVLPPVTLNSAELRYRYKDSLTQPHMGGPTDARTSYRYVGEWMKDSNSGGLKKRTIDLVCVRVLYALHDIPRENGPLSVVPATHKSNFSTPYKMDDPHLEPGMIPVPMKAGDAIFFTENLRHGGFRNLLDTTRKTIHLIYSQDWAGSVSPVHFNGLMRFRQETWDALTPEQRALFPQAELHS